MGILDGYIEASKRPTIMVDAGLKKNFSKDKLMMAEKNAIELVNDLPNSRTGIKILIEERFGKEFFKEKMSFGLDVFGKKHELSLIVTFTGNTPNYKLSAIPNPDFTQNKSALEKIKGKVLKK